MDYADSKKVKKITWNAPKKADRPKSAPKSLKDLITATMSRHGIGRQVSAGMVVERLNIFLRDMDPELAKDVRVVSFRFNEVKIGLSHRAYQEKVKAREEELKKIASEFSDGEVRFRYSLVDPSSMI